MASLKYWLWLTTRRGLSNTGVFSLLDHFGSPEAVHFSDPEEYDLIPGIPGLAKASLLDKSMDGAERIMAECDRLGQRILTFSDAGYPERLRNLYDPPVVLYLRGKDIHFDDEVAVGLIGTREPTPYGVAQARQLGHDLGAQGAVVVSGLARGLDSEAIRGALQGGGTVAAVLGGGLDVIYPPENRYLYEDVAAMGLLLSEYPPGTEARGPHFPVRNRIISGLSLGIVVVEGGFVSGTRITARAALDQNRDVFAVPGPVDAPMSYTPNDLIRQGEAALITCAADILEEYRGIYPHKIHLKPELNPVAPTSVPGRRQGRPQRGSSDPVAEQSPAAGAPVEEREEKPPETPLVRWQELTPALSEDQRSLLAALGGKSLTLEELVELTQIPARRATSAVTMLQLSGLVDEGAGKRFSAKVRIQAD